MRFTRKTFAFLRDLQDNNNVDWFHAHRDDYIQFVRQPALGLITHWSEAMPDYIGRARPVGGALAPPNRDIRFNRDKRPYRTHIAIRLRHRFALPGAPGPTFLLWIDPEGSFLAAGVHAYQAESLRRLRDAIQADPAAWHAVRGLGELDDHDLAVRGPGHPDPLLAHDLRRRHYTVTTRLRQADVLAGDFVDRLVTMSQHLRPFADWTADALYAPKLL